MTFRTILIVGGTHGNERTGARLVRHWSAEPGFLTRTGIATELLLANPSAVKANRRFIDRDLNRAFDPVDTANTALEGQENRLARALTRRFKPDGVPRCDLIIDMHTSTANMGVTLISDTNPFNLKLAEACRRRLNGARIYAFGPETLIHTGLRSMGRHGIGIEVGPTPQGVLRHEVLTQTRDAVGALLDVASDINGNGWPVEGADVEVYLHESTVPFPMTPEGEVAAVVHRDLEGRDFMPIGTGDAVFQDLEGGTRRYEGTDGLYPVFINEAAYYSSGKAFSLTRKIRLHL
jgi:aspartoacylase